MYLISLYFDDVTNERIQSYMNQIAKRTGNDVMLAGKVPPHITLSAFETTQESEAVVVFEDLAKEFICGEIMWCSVGIFFPHTIYLLPVMNHYLFQMSEQAYQYISQIRQVKIHQRYQPFSWIPHSTIGKQLSQTELKEAFVVMQEQFGMFRGTAVGIGLAKTNPYTDICRVWYDPVTGKCIQNDKKAMQVRKQWK